MLSQEHLARPQSVQTKISQPLLANWNCRHAIVRTITDCYQPGTIRQRIGFFDRRDEEILEEMTLEDDEQAVELSPS